jgi:peptidyl-prolyl cis-trans isomerase C
MHLKPAYLLAILGCLSAALVAAAQTAPPAEPAQSAKPPAKAAPTAAAPTAAAPTVAAPTVAAPTVAAPTAAAPVLDPAEVERRSKPLVTYQGGEVTVGELEDAIVRQSPFMRQRYLDVTARRELLEKHLRFELLAAEAERRGFAKDPTVEQAIKQNAVQGMMKTAIDTAVTPESITAAEVKAYYDAHLDEFVRAATRRASQVVVATEAEAKALVEQAKSMDMRGFRELARDKSIDEDTKLRGGDLRYFDAKGSAQGDDPPVDAELAKAVFTLANVGDTYPKPVKLGSVFAVLKLTGVRPANERTLAQADETIRMRLWRDKRQGMLDTLLTELRAKYKPEVHPELVDAIEFDKVELPKSKGIPEGFPAAKEIVDQAH